MRTELYPTMSRQKQCALSAKTRMACFRGFGELGELDRSQCEGLVRKGRPKIEEMHLTGRTEGGLQAGEIEAVQPHSYEPRRSFSYPNARIRSLAGGLFQYSKEEDSGSAISSPPFRQGWELRDNASQNSHICDFESRDTSRSSCLGTAQPFWRRDGER